MPIGEPLEVLSKLVIEGSESAYFLGSDIEQGDSSESLVGLEQSVRQLLVSRGPSDERRGIRSRRNSIQNLFVAAIQIGCHQPVLAYLRIICSGESNTPPIGRERDVTVNAPNHGL